MKRTEETEREQTDTRLMTDTEKHGASIMNSAGTRPGGSIVHRTGRKIALAGLLIGLSIAAFAQPVPAQWVQSDSGKISYLKEDGEPVTGLARIGGKLYDFNDSGVMLTGWRKIRDDFYFFRADPDEQGYGSAAIGWNTILGKRYYFRKDGVQVLGWIQSGGKLYYQIAAFGVVTGKQIIDGEYYFFDDDGAYNAVKTKQLRGSKSKGMKNEMLFFTEFESGSAGYGQTGGDGGNACGKYQFDRRYSLQPFLSYAYSSNPYLFARFRKFAMMGNTAKTQDLLKGNQELYSAWNYIYVRYPEAFAYYQDKFAEMMYYDTAAARLRGKGINLEKYPYVVRGAVFSYAIQHGAQHAADSVLKAGITPATSAKDFLRKLYDYRWEDEDGWNQESIYLYRYLAEKEKALKLLK